VILEHQRKGSFYPIPFGVPQPTCGLRRPSPLTLHRGPRGCSRNEFCAGAKPVVSPRVKLSLAPNHYRGRCWTVRKYRFTSVFAVTRRGIEHIVYQHADVVHTPVFLDLSWFMSPIPLLLAYNYNYCNTQDATPKGDITMCFWSSRYHLCMGSHYWIKDSSCRSYVWLTARNDCQNINYFSTVHTIKYTHQWSI